MPPTLALPPHLTVRAPTRDEMPAIFALIRASDLDVFGRTDYTYEELQRDWGGPEFDPATDTWVVAEPDGRLIGYAHCSNHGHFRNFGMGVTHPDHYGQGIGTTLARLIEARAREHIPLAPPEARVYLTIGIAGTDQRAAGLLANLGYRKVRRFSRMQILLDAPPPEPVWPEGIVVRTMVAGQDERAIWQAMEESFSDHWGHSPEPFEHWLARHQAPGRMIPDLQFLAMAGDTVAGAALCAHLDDFGWVDTLGVRRQWRKHGVGMALLQHVFGEFYRRGTREVGLGVDSQSLTGATRLYERAGMHAIVNYDAYEIELRPGVELSVQSLEDDGNHDA